MNTPIQRARTNARMSQIVVHGGTVYLAGQVAGDAGADIQDQARQVFERIDALLAEAGTDRAHLLGALIHLADLRQFEAFNAVWDAWVPPGAAPARTCVEAHLARPELLVEVTVTAALPG